jgi:hypothetical protein
MNQSVSPRKPIVDWLTVIAIAAISISLNVAVHEGVHALTCLATGSHLTEYSALYVSCDTASTLQRKLVDGSAPMYNLLAGFVLLVIVRNSGKRSHETRYFLWLFMLMNLLYGAGYWMFSGIANVGDMATVIAGWQPAWVWRVLITLVGSALFMFMVWLALQQFGRMVGGDDPGEQIRRANKLSLLSYATAIGTVLLAGFFSPPGFLSLPVTAGLAAAIGGLSPLAWMMQWFRAKNFVKPVQPPLEIQRKWQWLAAAVVVVLLYVLVLGRTLYF